MNIIIKSDKNDKQKTYNFTKDQQNAYDKLIEFINSEYDENNYKIALTGAAGTGKTYLLKAIIENCNLSYSTIGVAAPTHKACRVLYESIGLNRIKINTLGSVLGLRPNYDSTKFDINNPPFDPRGKIKIKGCFLYIIDEASMIESNLCKLLEKVCKVNKCKIIYVGDSFQLPPVGEKHSYAFHNIPIYELNEIVRQGIDNPISPLLTMLRKDIKLKTHTFLEYIWTNKSKFNEDNTKGYKVCNDVEFQTIMYNNYNDETLTKNIDFVKTIAYTNGCVNNYNNYIRNSIIKDCDKSIITKNDLITSYCTIVNQFNDVVIENSEEYIIKDVVNYVHPKYQLKGFMIRFIKIHGGEITTPLFIVDHTDKFTLNMYVKITQELINSSKNANIRVKSQKWKDYYNFKESCLLLTNIIKNDGTIIYKRDLDYGFALTSHKSQGSTFDTIFVDVHDIVYDKRNMPYTDIDNVNRRLYVACGRCKNKLYLKL